MIDNFLLVLLAPADHFVFPRDDDSSEVGGDLHDGGLALTRYDGRSKF